MVKKCDNKSVGIIVRDGSNILLIERKLPPYGFAPPAGHVDDHGSFEDAARAELKEEVGLDTENLRLRAEGTKTNPCRREGGDWHHWQIFEAEVSGEILASERETKQVGWHDEASLYLLGRKTEDYRAKMITDEEWEAAPGIEPIWHEWFKQLDIL